MKTPHPLPSPSRTSPAAIASARNAGFALVITLSLMVLLMLLALGMLSLSSVSLRTSAQSADMNLARANARMALLLALGELQSHAGSDTRVTARADILDEANPPVTGVWKSWEGTDHETTGNFAGRPVSPGNYKTKKEDRFLAWLVSGSTPGSTPGDATVPVTTQTANSVTLVGSKSVGGGDERANLQIHLAPTLVTGAGKAGGFAWWIGGENQKARLPKPYKPDNDTAGRWAAQAKSHAVADPEPFRLEPLLTDPATADKAITLGQADLIEEKVEEAALAVSREFFHDLSAVSTGLLTNTATGGWRKDLSLLTESWEDQPKDGLPLFRITPTSETQASIPTSGNPRPASSMLYPWATYGNGPPILQHGPVTSWENLVNYATIYRDPGTITTPSGRISTALNAEHIFGDSFKYLHRVQILPVIARMHWVLSHSAAPSTTVPGEYNPRLLLTPAFTMWNPYSMAITSWSQIDFKVRRPTPVALKYTINGSTNTKYHALSVPAVNNNPTLGRNDLNYHILDSFTLMPGETRLFSPASDVPKPDNRNIKLEPGYRSGGGHFFDVRDDSFPGYNVTPPHPLLSLPGSATLKVAAKFDTRFNDYGGVGVGTYLDMYTIGRWVLAYRMNYTKDVAASVYEELEEDELGEVNEGELGNLVNTPQPFLSTVFGARMASNTHLAAKGFVQSSPFVNYTTMGGASKVDLGIEYGGVLHPVNSPFDYSFIPHAAGGGNQLPNADEETDRGYIVTGFDASDGLSRCVIAELPSRPLASLGELVNWDLRAQNPIPPYALNLIGNSDATPLLPANAVFNSAQAGLTKNLQNDDSYCANHLLFDDWFLSSITPDPTDFGTSGRSLQKTFTDFVTGKTPLVNRSYQPILEDRATTNARQLYKNRVAPTDSWKTIASRLEVEGMFNVNSTSVAAWRALLGHARKQRVPYVAESGTSWKPELSDETDYVLSRFTIAGDTEAGTPSSSGDFLDATEFTGYRTVDDEFLDAMAEEVVKQVRARGPFLSLAEFVNRQLSSGDLALAGTIQAALNQVSEDLGTFSALVGSPVNQPTALPDAGYQFPEAAVGYKAYGLPGWTRQADILRPLAPILSARDDTFIIRAYGDARSPDGKVLARAVCEAVVRRTREFVDPADAADLTTQPTQPVNQTFGRRFQVVSWRWLAHDEV
ncbi:MAG: hypothetical protein OSA84_12350 [Akkermansiaceae bacterium]|nr:hypothetical protein [Akkermansiaceae bacterium]